jgi:hypothetical protein
VDPVENEGESPYKMKPSSRRLIVVLLCGVAVVVGVLLALRGGDGLSPGQLPRRFGVVLAITAFLTGAAVGLRGYVPVYVGIAVYAITLLLRTPPSPLGGDSKSGALVLFLTLIPAYYTVPTALGAGSRRLMFALLRRLS